MQTIVSFPVRKMREKRDFAKLISRLDADVALTIYARFIDFINLLIQLCDYLRNLERGCLPICIQFRAVTRKTTSEFAWVTYVHHNKLLEKFVRNVCKQAGMKIFPCYFICRASFSVLIITIFFARL